MKSTNFIFLLLFLFFYNSSFSQGLIFDKEGFENGKEIEKSRADRVPASASLKLYAPHTFNQENSTCVAYSIASARTILIAKNNKLVSKDEITLNSISPHWIYYRSKDDSDESCDEGLNIEKAMKDLLNYGAPRMAFVEYPDFYPFTNKILCNYYPPNEKEDAIEAMKWTPDNIYRIKDLDGLKIALSNDMPVVVGMLVPESFSNVMGAYSWSSEETDNYENAYGHAMVVVGYDDSVNGGSVEILNSWGESWGKNGYIWIQYEDFLKYTLGAYAIEKVVKFGSKPNLTSKNNLLELDRKLSFDNQVDSSYISRFKGLEKGFKSLIEK